MSEDIKPFTISVPDSSISLLKTKLSAATFPEEVEFSDDRDYGTALSDVKRLATYWNEGYDWRAHEKQLNEIPQFTTTISVDGFDDLDIHFVHQRSTRPGSIPLLFVHGWPGNFIEVTKILPLLTEPKDENAPSFHVVAPSLPNFGFSDRVSKRGFGLKQYAETMHKVMLKLGYDKYVTQGGDWGFFITRLVGLYYPDHCVASHTNTAAASLSFSRALWLGVKYFFGWLSDEEKQHFSNSKAYITGGMGYLVTQSTKPSTLGFAMADSPIALLAWVHEKLRDWTDAYPWTDDEILTWISIYQFSKAGPAASLTIYYEALNKGREEALKSMGHIPRVPLGISVFPKDLVLAPKSWRKTFGPVVFDRMHKSGGHFSAYECPEELVEDVRALAENSGAAVRFRLDAKS